jgi:hypothetical protein
MDAATEWAISALRSSSLIPSMVVIARSKLSRSVSVSCDGFIADPSLDMPLTSGEPAYVISMRGDARHTLTGDQGVPRVVRGCARIEHVFETIGQRRQCRWRCRTPTLGWWRIGSTRTGKRVRTAAPSTGTRAGTARTGKALAVVPIGHTANGMARSRRSMRLTRLHSGSPATADCAACVTRIQTDPLPARAGFGVAGRVWQTSRVAQAGSPGRAADFLSGVGLAEPETPTYPAPTGSVEQRQFPDHPTYDDQGLLRLMAATRPTSGVGGEGP